MLKDMRISAKLACGFGAVVAILAALGVISFVMFGRVDGNVTELGSHSLPAVKHATGVECAALEAIAAEKNYVLYKKDEYVDGTKAKLSELAASLDAADKVAEKFNDKELARKSKDVRGLAAQFGKLFDEAVAALKQNKAASDLATAKGRAVAGEADAYMAAKKTEYLEAKDALAIANELVPLIWELRYHRLSVFAQRSDKELAAAATTAGKIMKLCDQLEKMHPDLQEQGQVEDGRKAADQDLGLTKALRRRRSGGKRKRRWRLPTPRPPKREPDWSRSSMNTSPPRRPRWTSWPDLRSLPARLARPPSPCGSTCGIT